MDMHGPLWKFLDELKELSEKYDMYIDGTIYRENGNIVTGKILKYDDNKEKYNVELNLSKRETFYNSLDSIIERKE